MKDLMVHERSFGLLMVPSLNLCIDFASLLCRLICLEFFFTDASSDSMEDDGRQEVQGEPKITGKRGQER
jgi:hypothetical protein